MQTIPHLADRYAAARRRDPQAPAREVLQRIRMGLLPTKPLKMFSVMLLYPEGSGEPGDTFYTFADAADRDEAVREAIRECCMSNDWSLPDDDLPPGTTPDYTYDDFTELLVLDGQHFGI